MNSKFKKARFDMIKKLAKEKATEMPGLSEGLKGKKLSKVEVIAKDEEGLKKGLSKAQEILKAKFGEELSEEDSEDSEEELCEACEGEGCSHCEEECKEE